MPDMTDILTAHTATTASINQGGIGVRSGNARRCTCGEEIWVHHDELLDTETSADRLLNERFAAHVAAALETAGFGKVEGVTEWGVRYVSGFGAYTYESYEEAVAVGLRGVGTSVASRTVTAWKKET